MTTCKDHIVAFLIAGIYYWMIGQEEHANFCWQEGVWVLHHASFVGDA